MDDKYRVPSRLCLVIDEINSAHSAEPSYDMNYLKIIWRSWSANNLQQNTLYEMKASIAFVLIIYWYVVQWAVQRKIQNNVLTPKFPLKFTIVIYSFQTIIDS